ncbi:hypothetical protein [Saccharopolyspora gloriosae]
MDKHVETPVRHRIPLLPGSGSCPLWTIYDAFGSAG